MNQGDQKFFIKLPDGACINILDCVFGSINNYSIKFYKVLLT